MRQYEKNYNPITEYYDKIQSGEITVGDKIKRVYQKLVNDIHNQDESEYEYNPDRANHALEFIENFCVHIKGDMRGQPLKLQLWQKAMVAAIFGFINKETGNRKYTECVLIVARKNGKSLLASAIALYMLMADGEGGAEVVSASTKKDQSKIVWLDAKRMIQKSPVLNKRIRSLVGELAYDAEDGSFKPLSSDSNTLDGLNLHCSIIDELHAIEDKNLYDVLVDGMASRSQPLSLITTTAGTVRENIYDIKYDEVKRIVEGYNDPNGYTDESVLPIIYELDKRDEWMDETAWHKSNPNLEISKDINQLHQKVNKAKANPLLVKNLLTKDFNVPETASEAWLTYEQLNNQDTFSIEELKPKYGVGGIDLSQTTDLTAACVTFMIPGDETIYSTAMYWIPEDLFEKRIHEDNVPYDIWKQQDLIRTTPGNQINYKFVVDWFLEIRDTYGVYLPWIGYDSWSAEYFVDDMRNNFGKNAMIPVIQGKKTLSQPMRALGADLEKNAVNYNNNPITKWCLSNTSVEVDKNNNIQPAKGKQQRKRIDGTAALLNSYVVLNQNYNEYINMI